MENANQKILGPQEKTIEKPAVEERPGIVEAVLFVSGDAVEKTELCRAMNLTTEELDEALDALESLYDFERRGLRLLRFGAHVQLTTRPDYATYVEHLLQPVQRQSLSQAIMETLAVIAYKQPVTKAEVEQIRGVKCDYSIQSLISKGLIAEAGRKEALGRPILYATTDDFLRHFCISSLADLPEIDFSRLAKDAEKEEGIFDLGTQDGLKPESEEKEKENPAGETEQAGTGQEAPDEDTEKEPAEHEKGEPDTGMKADTAEGHPAGNLNA